jgi:hypothetical protein
MSLFRKVIIFDKLPAPSEHEDYWLGEIPEGPAIFKAGIVETLEGPKPDRWFCSFGGDRGIMWDKNKQLRYFASPEEALAAMREANVKFG